MNFLKFLIILLFGVRISLAEEKTTPIRLCCKPSEYLNTTHYRCDTLPGDFNVSTWAVQNFWSTGLGMKVNILADLKYSMSMPCSHPIVYTFFEYKNDGEHCYSPYYHKQKQKYIIATLDCDFTAKIYFFIYSTYIFGVVLSSIFSLITCIIYKNLEEFKHMMHWRLLLSYFIAWSGSHLLVIVCICLMFIEMVPFLWFCFISSQFWLNCLGYEVWQCFTNMIRYQSLECNKGRFLFYNCYAWGVAVLSTLPFWILKDLNLKKSLYPCISVAVILSMTSIAFIYIVCKLFTFRKKDKCFVKQSIILLLILLYLMILPWIIFLLWLLYPRSVLIVGLFYFYLLSEGPVLFALFIPVKALRLFCCKKRSHKHHENLIVEMQTLR